MLEIKKKLEEIAAKYIQPEHGRGYAMSVVLDGRPLLKYYSGNVKIDDIFYPVNENTPFNVGSLSKQFTACCIAILACEKRINLNDPVRDYLPEMKEYADRITIKHLISMTAGVREIYCLKYMQSCSPLGEIELFYRQEQPANDVGKYTGYSNTCYTLLGKIVEKLTGNTAQFAKQRIFIPLGMATTQGYGDMGADGLTTTANDLVLWHNCLMNKYLPGAPDGLFDLIFSPFTFNDGELCPYGFGFFYDKENRDIIWQHGDMGDWQCIMRVYLKKKLSVIVLAHFKEAEHIKTAIDLENAVISELLNLPKLPNQENYEEWYSGDNGTFQIKKVEHAEFPNAQKQNLLSENSFDKYLGRYYSYEMDTYFDIIPDGDHFQIKYADKNDEGYINLFDISDINNIKMHTRGDWGGDLLPIDFYGDERKIDFFTLREGCGHFYFIKCANKQNIN